MPLSTAVLDACVLVPVSLADTLLRIAEKGLYRPLWSGRILAEAHAAIAEIRPGTDVTKRFGAMREAFGDALVTGWERLEDGISLPDEDDRHVVAAAIQGGANAIVTANVSDFPARVLQPLDLELLHPDDFLLDQLDLSPAAIVEVIREQAGDTKRPPLTAHDLVAILGRAGVPRFAAEVLRLISSP
jgi:predicted nucleic acid-binding protein